MKSNAKLWVCTFVFFASAIVLNYLEKGSEVRAIFGFIGGTGIYIGMKEIFKQFREWKQEEDQIKLENKKEKEEWIKSTFVNFKKINF